METERPIPRKGRDNLPLPLDDPQASVDLTQADQLPIEIEKLAVNRLGPELQIQS